MVQQPVQDLGEAGRGVAGVEGVECVVDVVQGAVDRLVLPLVSPFRGVWLGVEKPGRRKRGPRSP